MPLVSSDAHQGVAAFPVHILPAWIMVLSGTSARMIAPLPMRTPEPMRTPMAVVTPKPTSVRSPTRVMLAVG